MDPKLQEKIERDSTAIQIRAGLQNLRHLPFMTDDIRKQIDEELPKLMPVLKDLAKKKIYELSEKLGKGESKKIYVLKNSKNGPEFSIWKNIRAFDADKETSFSLHVILDRIEKCDNVEELLSEILSFKIFASE